MTRPTRAALGLLAVTAVGFAFWLPLMGLPAGSVVSSAGCDTAAHFYAWRHYGFGMLARGELALWNPYALCGVPFLANVQSALLYPVNLLFLWPPIWSAINLSFLIHLLLAGLGACAFALVLGATAAGGALAGCVFMLSANVVHQLHAGHLPALCTLAWCPWLLCAAEGFLRTGRLRWCLAAGLAAGAQLLAGHLQYAAYSQLLCWLYVAVRLPAAECRSVLVPKPGRVCLGLALLAVVPAGLAAAQLLPAAEFARVSIRRELADGFAGGYAFPPWQLLTLVAPELFGGPRSPYWGHGYFWEAVCFVGAPTLVLAWTGLKGGKRSRVAAVAVTGAFALLFALGRSTPVFGWTVRVVPGLGLFRGPAKLMFAASLTLSVLAGLGLPTLCGSRKLAWILAGLGAALVGVWAAARLGRWGESARWAELVRAYATRGRPEGVASLPAIEELPAAFAAAASSVLASGLALFAAAGAVLSTRVRPKLGLAAVAAVVVVGLMLHGGKSLTTFDSRRCHMPAAVRKHLAGADGRVIAPEIGLLNRGMADRVCTLDGFDAIMPAWTAKVLGCACVRPVRFLVNVDRVNSVTRLLAARYVLYRTGTQPGPGMAPALRTERYTVWLDTHALGRGRIERGNGELVARTVPLRCREHRVVARLDGPAPSGEAAFVLADTAYPGWRAYVDGRRTPVTRSHGMLRRVALAGGRAQVELVYCPRAFAIGFALSLLTCAAVGVAVAARAGRAG